MAPRIPGVSDLVGVLQVQAEALAQLPHTLVMLNKSVVALAEAIIAARDTIVIVQRLAKNADVVVTAVAEPLELLAPQLTRVAAVLDASPLDEIPALLGQLTTDVMPILRGLRNTQAQVAGIAGTTDRLIGMVDDATQKLQALSGLPGAGLLTRGRGRNPAGDKLPTTR